MFKNKSAKKIFLISLFPLFTILFVIYYVQTYQESVFSKGFPIPGNVRIVKISNEHHLESYKWHAASEEHGLPLRYKAVIRFAGWKKVDTFGAMTTYEKDNSKVEILSSTNRIDIYSHKQE